MQASVFLLSKWKLGNYETIKVSKLHSVMHCKSIIVKYTNINL